MSHEEKTVADDRSIVEEAEAIMGQYLFALGAGASGQWIDRSAITYVREHYMPSILAAVKEAPGEWQDVGWKILHYLNIIGRLAAEKATSDGRDAIGEGDISVAMLTVENHYRDSITSDTDPVSEGKWCP